MSEAAIPNPDAAGSGPLPHGHEYGKDSLNRLVERTRHTLSGLRFTVEKCPDATRARAVRGATLFGGAGATFGLVLRRHPLGVVWGGLVGAVAGVVASRYHMAFDWDPDRAFGGERRGENQ